ncbi:MAG TPA: TlpA family protein disulfide reductase [Candidatus Baltobacteraceae bacterium]|nr:TlpA family protein disulfide reductase [Candidatus Baltobacteraceae bacterium]
MKQRAATNNRRNVIIAGTLGALAVAIIVAIALASRVPQTASQAPILAPLAVGQTAPEFSVATTHGEFDLAKSTDKPTLLELFATWCPHCQAETSVLNRVYDRYGPRANVVAVSASEHGMDGVVPASQADVVDFMNRFDVRYPIAFDPNLDVAHKYLQGGFPTLVLIQNGKVVAIGDGEIPYANLAAAFDSALAGRPLKADFGLQRPLTSPT